MNSRMSYGFDINILCLFVQYVNSASRQDSYDESLNPFGGDNNANAGEERVKIAEVKSIK